MTAQAKAPNYRNSLVYTTIKRKGLRKVCEVTITDGRNKLEFTNSGGFEVDTDKPLKTSSLRSFS